MTSRDPVDRHDGLADDSDMPRRRRNDPLQWRDPGCRCAGCDDGKSACDCEDDGSVADVPLELDDHRKGGFPRLV